MQIRLPTDIKQQSNQLLIQTKLCINEIQTYHTEIETRKIHQTFQEVGPLLNLSGGEIENISSLRNFDHARSMLLFRMFFITYSLSKLIYIASRS